MGSTGYVGRGGDKLNYALDRLGLQVEGAVAADFGCNIGGFTDCLLQKGAAAVYAVDTGYGMLEWKLRRDNRVMVMERTNAMHVELPEPLDVIAIDVGWTRQRYILPHALTQVSPDGFVLSLFKPQYEAAPPLVRGGVVAPQDFGRVLREALEELEGMGVHVRETVRLPEDIAPRNPEAFLYVLPQDQAVAGA